MFPRWSDGITLIFIKSHVRCHSSVKWKWIALNNHTKPTHTSRTIEEEEEAMEQAMAEALEDERLDDGAIEVGSEKQYQ